LRLPAVAAVAGVIAAGAVTRTTAAAVAGVTAAGAVTRTPGR
jgi:hypothetical protein